MALWTCPASSQTVPSSTAGPPSAGFGGELLGGLPGRGAERRLQHQVLRRIADQKQFGGRPAGQRRASLASARAAAHLGGIAGDVADRRIELGEGDREAVGGGGRRLRLGGHGERLGAKGGPRRRHADTRENAGADVKGCGEAARRRGADAGGDWEHRSLSIKVSANSPRIWRSPMMSSGGLLAAAAVGNVTLTACCRIWRPGRCGARRPRPGAPGRLPASPPAAAR